MDSIARLIAFCLVLTQIIESSPVYQQTWQQPISIFPSFHLLRLPRKVTPTNEKDVFYETFWFNQTVDHFSFSNNPEYFLERYLVSEKHWDQKNPGPIFFYTGNEGDITMFWDNSGFVTEELAAQFGALVVFAEHRYYGKSLPFGIDSFSLDHIKYLTSEQALADYAVLIRFLKKSYNCSDSPVFAFGGSYGGMLSAWFRIKYPHVVAGAIASSAPVLQFYDTGVSQWIFAELTTNDFSLYDVQCPNSIREAFLLIQQEGKSSKGRESITAAFGLCSPLQSEADISLLINWISNGLYYMAMINYPYPTDFLTPVPAWPVKVSCERMLKGKDSDLIMALASAVGVYYNWTGNQSCYHLNSSGSDDLGVLGWDYQACTEMVMPMGTNGTSDMFLPAYWDYEGFEKYCQQRWNVLPRRNWITTEFGGQLQGKLNDIMGSNILFSNGILDPWRGGGVQHDISEKDDLIAILIEEGAHHLDLRSSNPADPESVITARKKESYYLRHWIDLYHREKHSIRKKCTSSLY